MGHGIGAREGTHARIPRNLVAGGRGAFRTALNGRRTRLSQNEKEAGEKFPPFTRNTTAGDTFPRPQGLRRVPGIRSAEPPEEDLQQMSQGPDVVVYPPPWPSCSGTRGWAP
jgi:hypothetical protein